MRTPACVCSMIAAGGCPAAGASRLAGGIREADRRLSSAPNTCDPDTMGAVFPRDPGFYRDITWLSGYDRTMAAFRDNCDRRLGLRRELAGDSMRVHAPGDFGALQEAPRVLPRGARQG